MVRHMKIFGVAGFKNAGKTTLVVELIRELRSRGVRVATVKHAHHEFDIDHPGKDSHQHREAGAEEVIVASTCRWAHIKELGSESEPQLDELLSHFGNVDLVLVEGYKHGSHPKLELRRAGLDHPELATEDPAIRLIVADYPVNDAPVPVLPRDDVAAVVDFILQSD